MKIRACLNSGFCCKQAPCGFGDWNEDKTQCKHLMGDKPGDYYCGIYAEILKDPTSVVSPAFGAGCCSPLGNVERDGVIQARGGNEVFVTHVE